MLNSIQEHSLKDKMASSCSIPYYIRLTAGFLRTDVFLLSQTSYLASLHSFDVSV